MPFTCSFSDGFDAGFAICADVTLYPDPIGASPAAPAPLATLTIVTPASVSSAPAVPEPAVALGRHRRPDH